MVNNSLCYAVIVKQKAKTMSRFDAITREVKFAARDYTVWLWLVVILCLSTVAVAFGLAEVKRQNTTIQNLIESDRQDRLSQFYKLKDWGSTAYYTFHLSYKPPSDFAYAAMGQRDSQPWKHRIRMLALEGQIYESDVGNPSTALIGRFDFAFLIAFILPLVLIMLLYDLRTSEKNAGRHELLEATIGQPFSLWLLRALVRISGLFLCLIIPLIIAGIIAGTAPSKLLLASFLIFVYIIFWGALCFAIAAWRKSSSVILMTLISVWVATAVILPAGGRLAIDRLVPVPSGADILMLQRETVNDAWDLPREITMDAFFNRYPQWSNYQKVTSSFEWQWYYAFQEVGDLTTQQLTQSYQKGRIQRDKFASWVALLCPPVWLEQTLQTLAQTDKQAMITYENKVRDFHRQLKNFYYPKFFSNKDFNISELKKLPVYMAD